MKLDVVERVRSRGLRPVPTGTFATGHTCGDGAELSQREESR